MLFSFLSVANLCNSKAEVTSFSPYFARDIYGKVKVQGIERKKLIFGLLPNVRIKFAEKFENIFADSKDTKQRAGLSFQMRFLAKIKFIFFIFSM